MQRTHNLFDKRVFKTVAENFEELALEIFRFQVQNNSVYKEFIELLGVDVSQVKRLESIPFLPIELFKTHKVLSTKDPVERVFESSGTTSENKSRHLVTDQKVYEESFRKSFERFYGPIKSYCILGLLPAYLEQRNSSLVYMIEKMIRWSTHELSGFYLKDFSRLKSTLELLQKSRQKTIFFGVSFALLDFAEKSKMKLSDETIVMETGGMKGRREELTRFDLHERLKSLFKVQSIHSEYGMTELLSQAYSLGNGRFHCPAWMKVSTRDVYDPKNLLQEGQTGALNIIDLANFNSCSFIATSDLGTMHKNGEFEVLGRIDNSEIRGCSLMVSML